MNAQKTERKATILVVEDDVEMVWMIGNLLEQEGYAVVGAQSGEEALDLLGLGEPAQPEPAVQPDLILLDVLMEGIDGYEVCARLKQEERLGYIPIIMVTVLDSLVDKVNGLELGADDYIAKPFKSEELLARIRALLRVKRLQDELRESEDRLRGLFETMAEGVVLIAPDGQIVQANPAAERILGLQRSEIESRNYVGREWEIVRPDGTPMPPEEWAGSRAMKEKRLVKDVVMGVKHPDGAISWINVSAAPLIDKGGELEGVVGTFADITERVQAEEELRRHRDHLEELVEERTAELTRANEQLRQEIAERKRVEERIRREARRTQALARTATRLNTQLDLETVLNAVCEAATQALDVPAATISLRSEADEVLQYAASLGLPVEFHQRAQPVPCAVFDEYFQRMGPIIVVPDMQTLSDLPNADLYAALNIRSSVGTALVRDGQVIGVLYIFSIGEVRHFEEDELTLLQGLADQATLAIANARLYEQVQRDAAELEQRVAERTRDLTTLYDVMAAASESLDLQITLERSLERVLEALGCRTGVIQLLDETEDRLYLAVHQGIPPDLVAQLGSLPADSGLMGWVLERGEPLVVTDVAADPRAAQVVGTGGFHKYLGTPMWAGGQVQGVLSVFGEAGQQFSAEDVALLGSVADHVGVAVENARLHQRAEEAAVMEERQRLARELHDSVTQWLYGLTLHAEVARELAVAGDLDRVRNSMALLGETALQALKEMRLLIYQLRPDMLGRAGLVDALQQRLDAVEGRAGVETRLLVEEDLELPPPVGEGLYRIAQEALNNALKHAAATSVTVRIRTEGQHVELEVVDHGRGFDPSTVSDRGGMGLINMRERAEALGGSLAVLSAPGEGTRVKVGVSL